MMHRSLSFLALLFCLAAAHAEPSLHEMLPMPDGTRLATDVYLPKGEGPWPVILARSTYGRMPKAADEFVSRGYAAVIQDVRGMGTSEGEKRVFFAEGWREGQTDGADTVAWIKAQPWCDGRIGTHGGSALAITQMLLAPTTSGVHAQYMDMVPSDFYGDVAYQGGVLCKNLIEGWLTAIQQPHMIPVYKAHPLDDAFWADFDVEARAKDISAPGFFVGGWYDIFQQGTIDGFVTRQNDGAEGARGKNILVMKWSPHGPDKTPDYTWNENRFDLKMSKLKYAFFEYHLKGKTDALDEIKPVNYYVLGADTPGAPGNEWRSADTWPPYETTPTAFHLHADGTLAPAAPEAGDAKRSFRFDPADPVPTHGGANLLLAMGPMDQRKVSGRADVLKFETAPLDAPLEITGRVKAKLWVSSDAPDTDFTAKLMDVYPEGDGRELLMLDNIRRVKSRLGFDKAAPLLSSASEIVELEIDLWSIAWIFNKGHRVALHISSSNYPRFEVNPNTGDDFPGDGVTPRVAENTVHLSAAHPSALILPVRR